MPLGRGATPEEICAAIRFLLDTPSVTGQMIALDGGQHLAWR
jgi:NAD(P)-dependent dehydrogenase (short-subunit alcohol dehydrogenase family)